jgi:hypothetical protein
MLLDA